MSRLEKLKQEMLDAVDSICESYKKELEAKEVVYEYPIYKVSIYSKQIVKFTNLTEGITMSKGNSSYDVGYFNDNLVSCTDRDLWLDLPYDKDTGFYDMQIITCRDKDWDFENLRLFSEAVNMTYNVIKPVEHPSEFMLEQQRLAIERFIDENK